MGFSPVHNVKASARYPRMLLLPALNDARTGFWDALKYAHAVRSNGYGAEAPARKQQVLVRTDMEGGHFRSGIPAERSRQRGLELGFLVAALREKIA